MRGRNSFRSFASSLRFGRVLMPLYPTTNVLYRVFYIRVIKSSTGQAVPGTAFAIDLDNREYVVTARHVAEHLDDAGVQVMRSGNWETYLAEIVGHGNGNIDISVLALHKSIVPNENRFPFPTGTAGAILGQEVMFLGFPDGLDPTVGFHLHHGLPVPLVKYARLSSLSVGDSYPMWIDGHVHPGFSGSPLCFVLDDPKEVRVGGVVTAYQPLKEPVFLADGTDTGMFVASNPGLACAWDIRHALDLIHDNPIGPVIG